jgi:hypothetical protein
MPSKTLLDAVRERFRIWQQQPSADVVGKQAPATKVERTASYDTALELTGILQRF